MLGQFSVKTKAMAFRKVCSSEGKKVKIVTRFITGSDDNLIVPKKSPEKRKKKVSEPILEPVQEPDPGPVRDPDDGPVPIPASYGGVDHFDGRTIKVLARIVNDMGNPAVPIHSSSFNLISPDHIVMPSISFGDLDLTMYVGTVERGILMKIIRSLGQKLTGKRINSVVSKAGMVDNRLPMKRQTSLVDEDRVSIITIGDGREPLLGVEVFDKFIDTDHLNGVFDDDEVFDAHMDKGRLVLTKGRNNYRFPLDDVVGDEPRLPQIDEFDTSFILDPHRLPKKYGKDCKDGYVKFSAGYDENGSSGRPSMM